MKILTFKEAKRLSLLKWKYISEHEGGDIGLLQAHPELKGLWASCGLCELHNKEYTGCRGCPLQDKNVEICCHEFTKWVNTVTPRWEKYWSKKLYQRIQNLKEI